MNIQRNIKAQTSPGEREVSFRFFIQPLKRAESEQTQVDICLPTMFSTRPYDSEI
jgi:hypothetical protein